jgi:hypothetical protein
MTTAIVILSLKLYRRANVCLLTLNHQKQLATPHRRPLKPIFSQR